MAAVVYHHVEIESKVMSGKMKTIKTPAAAMIAAYKIFEKWRLKLGFAI